MRLADFFLFPSKPRQTGAALIEATVGLGIVLLTGLIVLETSHWQLTRQLAYIALLEAARAGATGHLDPDMMARAFETALLPRHASPNGAARQRMRAVHARIRQRSGLAPWHIQIQAPTPPAFRDFAQDNLNIPGARGRDAIRHDRQAEQHAANRQRWPAGRGPRSGQTIHEANVLTVRLRYLIEPLAAPTRLLLRAASLAATDDDCARQSLRAGMLPLHLQLAMDMQSHAVLWPDDRNTRVNRDLGC